MSFKSVDPKSATGKFRSEVFHNGMVLVPHHPRRGRCNPLRLLPTAPRALHPMIMHTASHSLTPLHTPCRGCTVQRHYLPMFLHSGIQGHSEQHTIDQSIRPPNPLFLLFFINQRKEYIKNTMEFGWGGVEWGTWEHGEHAKHSDTHDSASLPRDARPVRGHADG